MALSLYNTLLSLKNLIDKNNTTTSSYDISSGLNKRIGFIEIAEEEFPVPKVNYPAVLIKLVTKDDDISQLGNQSRRKMNINFQVLAVSDYGAGSIDSQKTSLLELYRLSSNIELLLRNKPTLSISSCLWNTTDVNYDKIRGESIYNKTATITIRSEFLSQ